MSWPLLFSLTNAWALVGWLMLALLPRRPFVLAFVLYAVVGLLCLTYAVGVVGTVSGLLDPVRSAGATAPDFANFRIPSVRAIFATDAGVVLGWTHYLAFDLFVGSWIARDGDAKRIARGWQLPVLFVTLMAGPIGLLIWFGLRGVLARR